jgi:hypothetical protein
MTDPPEVDILLFSRFEFFFKKLKPRSDKPQNGLPLNARCCLMALEIAKPPLF